MQPEDLPDGTSLSDVRDAMRAAWDAGTHDLALDLATRYLPSADTVCTRCGDPARSRVFEISNPRWIYPLCKQCMQWLPYHWTWFGTWFDRLRQR